MADKKEIYYSHESIRRAADIFAQHGDFIRSVIAFNVQNRDLTEDLFQDFFLFLACQDIVEDIPNMQAYLYKLISIRTKESLRRINHYRARIKRYALRGAKNPAGGAEQPLIETEEIKKIFGLIEKKLPPGEALAVTLRYKDSFNLKEAAQQMKIKPNSVSKYISIGLKKMAQALGESEKDDI